MGGGGGGGGAGGGLATDSNARLIVEDDVAGAADVATDLRELPIFDFSTEVLPPTIVAGSSLGVAWGGVKFLSWGQSEYLHAGSIIPGQSPAVYLGPGPLIAPVLYPGQILHRGVKSTVSQNGSPGVSWVYTPGAWGCGVGFGSHGGWSEQETWLSVVVPAHPADMAGITTTVTFDSAGGAATQGGIVYVRDSAPVEGRSGTPVASIGVGATSVFIPGSLIPAEGGELWLGVGPAWQADYDYSDAIKPGNGDLGACALTPQQAIYSGFLGSGIGRLASVGTGTWAVYSAAGDGFPATLVLDDEEDPWEGGNDVLDAGTEGSPVSGVTDGTLYVEGPGGRGIVAVGDVEDEDQPRGPWADPYALGFRFIADVVGDTGDAQRSEIEVTTTRPGQRLVGTVHLGDTSSPAGISVSTDASAFQAVTVTAGDVWAAKFDDRSDGWFRGKLWRVSDGEPADWTVEVAVPDETADTGDRLAIWVRSQTGQTIRLWPPEATTSAPGSWVHERLGVASGDADKFTTSHAFVPGTLELELSGIFAPPSREDAENGHGWLDYKPTAGMVAWARYLAQ